MSAKVHALVIAKWDPLTDAKGRRVPKFLVHRKTGVIYYRESFKRLGIPDLFVSTGEKTIGRAKTAAQVLVNQHKNKHLGIDDSGVYGRKAGRTFASVAQEVLEKHTPKQRPTTQEKHRIYIPQLIEWFGSYDVNSITVEEFEEKLAQKRAQGGRRTFMDYAKHMNLIARYAYKKKAATHLLRFDNPDRGIETVWRVYTDDEIARLWEAMGEDLRDQFVLSYECMMRLREALYLTWDRVDLRTGKVTLRAEDVKTGSKTGRGREFILSQHALERLRRRFERSGGRPPYVFPAKGNPGRPQHSNKTAWNLAKRRAGIKGRARWHDLRHSGISKALLEANAAPIAVSKYAGVSLQTIDRVYLHARAEHTKQVSNAVSIRKNSVNPA